MRPQQLWMPGDGWLTTNQLLDLQRASGYYDGRAAALPAERRKPAKRTFNTAIRAMRDATILAARARKLVKVTEPVVLVFVHFGSGRRDASSWYLIGKAVEDGLVEAGVLGSDRFDVYATAGASVAADHPLWRERIRVLMGLDTEGKAGLYVGIGTEALYGVL